MCSVRGRVKSLPLIGRGASAPPPREDALFLAEAPAVVPEALASEFDAMGIRRLYVTAATLTGGGQVRPFPPPPNSIQRPVVLVLMGEPGAEAGLRTAQPELLGEAWANGAVKLVAEAKGWAQVTGVHLHLLPAPTDAPALAKALSVLKSRLKGLTVSVTLLPGAPEGAWDPLGGAADEALVFSFGRRPETADTFVREMSQEEAKAFPIPFRLLLVPGGYGVAGAGARLTASPTARSTSSRRTGTSISTSRPSSPAIPEASTTSSRGPDTRRRRISWRRTAAEPGSTSFRSPISSVSSRRPLGGALLALQAASSSSTAFRAMAA